MSEKIVHVVGTGTIGEPLIGLLSDYKGQLGIDEVSFHKNSPLSYERAKVRDLQNRGAKLAVYEEKVEGFKEIGIEPSFAAEEAIERASVVIDCTPKGIGHQNKHKYYERFLYNGRGFLAQGSEHGFGLKYARGINDSALTSADEQFVQIVSCNTHNIAALTKSITMDNGKESLSAYELFQTIDKEPNLFSSAMKTNSQYMHVIWFNLRLDEAITLEEVINRLDGNPLIALTEKTSSSSVFSFGRDHGHFGRILNQTVVAVPTLAVHNGNEVVGYCFTPQDGNSLLSSIAAATYFMYRDSYEERIQSLGHLFFSEV